MARLTFPSDRTVFRASPYVGSAFTNSAGTVATIYSDAAGTALADVQNIDTSANASATFTVDSNSQLPLFLGPASGATTLYVKYAGSSVVSALYAVGGGGGGGAVTSVAGGAASAKKVQAYQPNNFKGINRPSFSTIGLQAATNLSVSAGGNLVATTIGTVGSGRMKLPGGALDRTKPFAMGFRVKVAASSDAGNLQVILGNVADNARGMATTLYPAGITNPGGISPNMPIAGGLSVGPFGSTSTSAGEYDVWVTSDGTRVTGGCRKVGAAATNLWVSAGGSIYNDAAVNLIAWAVQTAVNYTGTQPTWDICDTLIIKSSTKAVELESVWVNVAGVAAPQNTAQVQVVVSQPIIAGAGPGAPANIAGTVVTRGWNGRDPQTLVLMGHPNGSDEAGTGAATSSVYPVHAALLDAGYVLGYVNGDQGATSGRFNSPWGAYPGLEQRKAFLDWVLANYPNINNVVWLGHSMGCLDGLNFHMAYPGYLKALVGLSGVCNLADSYTNRGFGTIINTAYTVPALTTPAGVTVTPAGTTGATTYGYRISAVDAYGETVSSATVTTTTGNATLTAANYNAITWTAQSNAKGYKVYGRTASGELLIATVTTNSYNDTGAVVTPAGALPGSNTTGLSSTTVTDVADHDPVQRVGALADLPTKFWHGASDALIPKANNPDVLSPLLTAAGGVSSVVSVAGGGHLDATFGAGVTPSDVLAFFATYCTT